MVIKNGLIALSGRDEPQRLDIKVEGGVITAIGLDLTDNEVINANGLLIIPGGIDPHVHFDDPGYTDREDFYHGTAAAAAGGITTVIDMPCTSVPEVTSLENLHRKLDVIRPKAVVDFGLHGGVSGQVFESGFEKPMEELADYVMGFKTYFISGMDTFHRLNHFRFQKVLEFSRDLGKVILLHAEDYDYVIHATEYARKLKDSPRSFYLSRPEMAEMLAVASAAIMAVEADAQLHIVHIATADAAALIAEYDNVTCETEPHYLAFTLEDFERMGSILKTVPIVKSPENKPLLWEYLADGVIDFVASDHAPAPNDQKFTGSIWTDYAGIPGTQTLLPLLFSEGYMKKRLTLSRFLQVMSENAARRFGFFHRKGSIEVGKDADLVFIDPDKKWVLDTSREFYSKGKITPFEGMEFTGSIEMTMVRGRVVYRRGEGILVEPGYGEWITPEK